MKFETYERMSPENAIIKVYKLCGDVNDNNLEKSHELTDLAAGYIATTQNFVETTKILDRYDRASYPDLIPFAVVIPKMRAYKILFADKKTHEIFYMPAILHDNMLMVKNRNTHPAAMREIIYPIRTWYKYDFFTVADIVCMFEYHNAHVVEWSKIYGLIILEDAHRVLGW